MKNKDTMSVEQAIQIKTLSIAKSLKNHIYIQTAMKISYIPAN